MTRPKPSAFIGSSSESRQIAEVIQEHLGTVCEAVVWSSDIFVLGEGQFDSLLRATEEFDFAIFVAAEDDILIKRDVKSTTPRDNVILELGLFVGALGKERVYIVSPSGANIALPSDLAGINIGAYTPYKPDRLLSALGPVSRRLKERIATLGVRHPQVEKTAYAAAICYKIDDNGLQFRLVKTSRGRWMFPKGKILPGEPPQLAALRYAEDEGGISGRPEILESVHSFVI